MPGRWTRSATGGRSWSSRMPSSGSDGSANSRRVSAWPEHPDRPPAETGGREVLDTVRRRTGAKGEYVVDRKGRGLFLVIVAPGSGVRADCVRRSRWSIAEKGSQFGWSYGRRTAAVRSGRRAIGPRVQRDQCIRSQRRYRFSGEPPLSWRSAPDHEHPIAAVVDRWSGSRARPRRVPGRTLEHEQAEPVDLARVGQPTLEVRVALRR